MSSLTFNKVLGKSPEDVITYPGPDTFTSYVNINYKASLLIIICHFQVSFKFYFDK